MKSLKVEGIDAHGLLTELQEDSATATALQRQYKLFLETGEVQPEPDVEIQIGSSGTGGASVSGAAVSSAVNTSKPEAEPQTHKTFPITPVAPAATGPSGRPATEATDDEHLDSPNPAAPSKRIHPDKWGNLFQRRRFSSVSGWSVGWYVVTYDKLAITSGPELISSLEFQLPKGELIEAVEVANVGSRVRAFIHVRGKPTDERISGWISLAANVRRSRGRISFAWARKVQAPPPRVEPVLIEMPLASSSLKGGLPHDEGRHAKSLGAAGGQKASFHSRVPGLLSTATGHTATADADADAALGDLGDLADRDGVAPGQPHTKQLAAWLPPGITVASLGANATANHLELGSFTGLLLCPGLPGFAPTDNKAASLLQRKPVRHGAD